jgi:hypothetical protein
MVEESADPKEPRLGPAAAGDDLQRLLDDMRHKGLSPGQLDKVRTAWEAACHDPMNKGRGGPTLPENEPRGRIPLPDPPPTPDPPAEEEKPSLVELLDRTAPWPGPETNV